MASSVIVEAGFLVALLSRRDTNHRWAAAQPQRLAPPWQTCEAVLSEAFHLLEPGGTPALSTMMRRGALVCVFRVADHAEEILALMRKYSNVPMSFADACLVRMTEALPDPTLLTTDTDFRIYRRHSRQIIPCVMPN